MKLETGCYHVVVVVSFIVRIICHEMLLMTVNILTRPVLEARHFIRGPSVRYFYYATKVAFIQPEV